MVLTPSSRIAILLCWALLTISCIPQRVPTKIAETTPIRVAVVIENPQRPELVEPPTELITRLESLAAARNLVFQRALATEEDRTTLVRARTSEARSIHLGEGTQGTEIAMLIEARPRFHSKIGGTYRWNIPARVTIFSAENPQQTLVHEFDTPAFLRLARQSSADALASVQLPFAQQVELAVDRFLLADAAAVATDEPKKKAVTPMPPPTE